MTPLQLPTKEQIAALTDLGAVTDLKDAVQKAIDHIEAQLEFGQGDDAWAKTATNALALHRYINRLLARRVFALRKPTGAVQRPREANDPQTNYVLRERPTFDPAQSRTLSHLDKALATLTDLMEAVEIDRSDEVANGPGRRDEGFLALTGGVLRRLRAERHALTLRRAELVRAQKRAERQAEERADQASREREFIEAAKVVLDRETYLRIWATVDRLRSERAAA